MHRDPPLADPGFQRICRADTAVRKISAKKRPVLDSTTTVAYDPHCDPFRKWYGPAAVSCMQRQAGAGPTYSPNSLVSVLVATLILRETGRFATAMLGSVSQHKRAAV
jgi:hypothetical protein